MSENANVPGEAKQSSMSADAGAASETAGMVIPVRRRAVHMTVAAVAIVALGWWSWYSSPGPDLREVMANPVAFEGQEIKIGDEPLLESCETDFFIVRSRGFRFRVSGSISSNDIGQFVYVRGIFHQPPADADWDGEINPAEHRVARGRHAKIWLSVIPVLWIGVLLLRHFRINWKRLAIEERRAYFEV